MKCTTLSALILISLLSLINSCSTDTEIKGNDDSKDNLSSKADIALANSEDEVGHQQVLFRKLTFEKYQNIRNSTDSFREIEISYDTYAKENASGRNDEIRFFGLEGGVNNWDPKYFNSIDEYKGGLYHVDDTLNIEEGFSKTFSTSEVEEIFDYLKDNHDYFFNHEEFFGKETVEDSSRHMTDYNYLFTLYIFPANEMTNEYNPCWVIEKGIDSYPEPGTPLYGLFQMLENDFIPQFEE